MNTTNPSGANSLAVFYDGACPVCRREISLYNDLIPVQPVEFVDVSRHAVLLPAELTHEQALARFHVRHVDGRIESGARAFIALWERLPYWRWLARVGRLPGVAALMEIAYRGFLRIRPESQRWCMQGMGQKRLMLGEAATAPLSSVSRLESLNSSCVGLEPPAKLPAWVFADLRTDHAGEVGAICIYQGVLQFARDPALRAFAERHLATEQKHLRLISGWLPAAQYSRLLPLWRLAGFLTGALPALFGPKAVYATIEAVETFVNYHYEEQILALASQTVLNDLRQTLLDCQADEVAHRDEATAARGLSESGWVLRAWCAMVGAGSKAAVSLIRHI